MKQEKLQLFTMDMKYVRDLHKVDDRVQSVSPQIHKSNRPFVGIVVVCNRRQYCIPLDHPKDKHYKMKNGHGRCALIDIEELDELDKVKALLKLTSKLNDAKTSVREEGTISVDELEKELGL